MIQRPAPSPAPAIAETAVATSAAAITPKRTASARRCTSERYFSGRVPSPSRASLPSPVFCCRSTSSRARSVMPRMCPKAGGTIPSAQGRSSIGRAPVSKTGGCRFESCRPCCRDPVFEIQGTRRSTAGILARPAPPPSGGAAARPRPLEAGQLTAQSTHGAVKLAGLAPTDSSAFALPPQPRAHSQVGSRPSKASTWAAWVHASLGTWPPAARRSKACRVARSSSSSAPRTSS